MSYHTDTTWLQTLYRPSLTEWRENYCGHLQTSVAFRTEPSVGYMRITERFIYNVVFVMTRLILDGF